VLAGAGDGLRLAKVQAASARGSGGPWPDDQDAVFTRFAIVDQAFVARGYGEEIAALEARAGVFRECGMDERVAGLAETERGIAADVV